MKSAEQTIKQGNDEIKKIADKFLGWSFPKSICPDGGFSFTPPQPPNFWHVGTNLLDATEAREMVEYLFGDYLASLAEAEAKVELLSKELQVKEGDMSDETQGKAINIIFDGPAGPTSGRFIEVETDDGKGVRVGKWIDRGDGIWALRIDKLPTAKKDENANNRYDSINNAVHHMSNEILQGPALHEKIAEVMRRREDWWVEFEVFSSFSAQWMGNYSRADIYRSMERGWDFRHRKPKVKLEGEVEPEVIEIAEDWRRIFRIAEKIKKL